MMVMINHTLLFTQKLVAKHCLVLFRMTDNKLVVVFSEVSETPLLPYECVTSLFKTKMVNMASVQSVELLATGCVDGTQRPSCL